MLKVEANPEFCVEFPESLNVQRSGEIGDFEPFGPFYMHGKPEKEELYSEAERADGIRFPNYGAILCIESFEGIKFCRVSLEL